MSHRVILPNHSLQAVKLAANLNRQLITWWLKRVQQLFSLPFPTLCDWILLDGIVSYSITSLFLTRFPLFIRSYSFKLSNTLLPLSNSAIIWTKLYLVFFHCFITKYIYPSLHLFGYMNIHIITLLRNCNNWTYIHTYQ